MPTLPPPATRPGTPGGVDALTAGRREELFGSRPFATAADLRLSRSNIDITVAASSPRSPGRCRRGRCRPNRSPSRRQVRDLAKILRAEEATTGMAAADNARRL
jgi:hypothetical protein